MRSAGLRVVIANHGYDQKCTPSEGLLDRYGQLTGWADGLRSAGAEVEVVQRFRRDDTIERNGVVYHLVGDDYGPCVRPWQIPRHMHQQVASLCPGERTLVHMNGLLFPLQARHLRASLPAACAMVMQHHAETPWRGVKRLVQRWGLDGVDGFFFTSGDLAREWIGRSIPQSSMVCAVSECSSTLTWQNREAARAVTQMTGDPVLLWTGNLTENKDPLTVLAGLEILLEQRPDARLYMAYREQHLLGAVRERLAMNQKLGAAVTLLGEVPYSAIGPYYNSADLFVQGSGKEGSGIALLDALACGVIPVVTNIPSFRALTNDGSIGALWPRGDARAFRSALRAVLERPIAEQSEQARAFFAANLSFPALGRHAAAAYDAILQKRTPK